MTTHISIPLEKLIGKGVTVRTKYGYAKGKLEKLDPYFCAGRAIFLKSEVKKITRENGSLNIWLKDPAQPKFEKLVGETVTFCDGNLCVTGKLKRKRKGQYGLEGKNFSVVFSEDDVFFDGEYFLRGKR